MTFQVFYCARGCGRLVYFEGDLCTPVAPDAVRIATAGCCLPFPKTEEQIRADIKRIKALVKARPSPFEAECEENFRKWMQGGFMTTRR